jgi:hypothetical protein
MAAEVAEPETNVTVPREVTPSKNSTVPATVPAPGETAATVAVKVMDCPKTDGFGAAISTIALLALLTTWFTAELVLVTKFESPPYSAVMLYAFPTAKEEVLNVATPLPFNVPVPSVVEPFLKVMVPDGVPKEPVTKAVKVIDSPKTDGLGAAISTVALLALLTTWLTAELVLVTKFASPPYSAVMLYELPTAKEEVLNVVTPLPFKVPVPSVVKPFLKVMVPDGVPKEPVTKAVKDTDSPKTDGFGAAISTVALLALLTTWLTAEQVLVT